MNDIVIVEAEPKHIEQIYAIETESFTRRWPKELLLEDIQSDSSLLVCALGSDEMLGYGEMMFIYDEAHIGSIAVRKACRRKGVGGAILGYLIDEAKYRGFFLFTLEVRVSNEAAIRLYEKFGFEKAGIRRNYYDDNREDAFIMWRKDKNENGG